MRKLLVGAYLAKKIRDKRIMSKYEFRDDAEYPKFLDNNDPLGQFRERFYIKKNTIYMCGNSLGLLSKDAEDHILHMLELWKQKTVKIWTEENSKYLKYSDHLAKLLAPLIGADPEEIAVMGCTTSNIHQVISTFYKPTKDRYKILVDDINFPTDKYAVDSQVRLRGYEPEDAVKVVKSYDGKYLNEDDIITAMTEDVAVILLSNVYYRTAQVLDMDKVTKAARERGILIGWDLCHSIGAIEIDLKSLDADFAIWCNYKYLNGGPGSTAALYINRKHFNILPGLAGWYGNRKETQFLLRQEFDHEKSASGWQIGTPPLLAMAPLEGSLKILNEAGISEIRKKSLNLTAYLMYLFDEKLKEYGFKTGNLREDSKRGGHVCVEHDEGYRISLDLKTRGVIADFRDPNVIRLTPAALYTRYEDVYTVVETLANIVKTKSYEKFSTIRDIVC